jgi:hypothetical protein
LEILQKQPLEPVFQPGEQIIVDTPIGMWPGIVSCTLHLQVNLLLIYDFKFESYVEGHPGMIRFSLFPRKTKEILIGHKDIIIPFPLDRIEVFLIIQNIIKKTLL